MTRRILVRLVALFLMAVCISAAIAKETADDDLSGVVYALEKNYTSNSNQASDELEGVVVCEPRENIAGVSEVRVCKNDDTCINVEVPATCTEMTQSGCTTDAPVTCSTTPSVPGYTSCASGGKMKVSNAKPPVCSLAGATSCGKVSFQGLTGDGSSTMSCKIQCENRTDKPLKVCIPQGQCFAPDDATKQIMACTEDKICVLPPKEPKSIPISSMCVSPKSIKPPPPMGTQYSLHTPSPAEAKLIDRVINIANVMEKNHLYDHLPGGAERPQTIAQLSHWTAKGQTSELAHDKMSPERIRDDLLEQAKLDYKNLSKKDQRDFDKQCAAIFQSANLTLKVSQSEKTDRLIAGRALTR